MTEQTSDPTPPAAPPKALPWRIDATFAPSYYIYTPDGRDGVVAITYDRGDAEEIVRSVNSHDILVAALQAVIDEDDRRRGYLPAEVLEQVRAALAAAGL